MKQTNWKGIAEFVGITAIVGSLVFVGIQLQLEHRIAIAEINQSAVESYISMDELVAEHARVFAKANSGEQLNDEEALIINRVVHSMHMKYRLDVNMRRSLGERGVVPPIIFALFLDENPGAHRAWLAMSEDEEKRFSLVSPNDAWVTNFRDEVLDALEKLKSSKN